MVATLRDLGVRQECPAIVNRGVSVMLRNKSLAGTAVCLEANKSGGLSQQENGFQQRNCLSFRWVVISI